MFLFSARPERITSCFPHSRGDVPSTSPLSPISSPFSPLTWGCSACWLSRFRRRPVFPTHVGMFRQFASGFVAIQSFPHSRGDVPTKEGKNSLLCKVFPTHVGMFLINIGLYCLSLGFPHSRGDVPSLAPKHSEQWSFSPLTWGCSVHRQPTDAVRQVFPTHVGMFRGTAETSAILQSFPHSRGDVPAFAERSGFGLPFSPLTWGCSDAIASGVLPSFVFPTHVGMFRAIIMRIAIGGSFPHSRGDVPSVFGRFYDTAEFSPLTWGCSVQVCYCNCFCFVFPTHVGMFQSNP